MLPVELPESHGAETDGLSHLSSVVCKNWCGIYLTCQKWLHLEHQSYFFAAFHKFQLIFPANETTDWRRGASVFTWRELAVSALVASSILTAGPSDALADNRSPLLNSQTTLPHGHKHILNKGIPQSFCDFQSECPSAFPAGCFSVWNKQQVP